MERLWVIGGWNFIRRSSRLHERKIADEFMVLCMRGKVVAKVQKRFEVQSMRRQKL
jgi:hypothetical protein